MKPHRLSLGLVTASAVALSLLPAVAGAQEVTTAPDVTATATVDEQVDQWPGSVEGSSMLLDGDIPPAPSFGSSQLGSSGTEKDEEKDEGGKLLDENGNIPVIGSISLPGWVAIPIGVAQALLAVTSFMAQAAYVVLPLMPNGTQILRDFLISVGINPDA